MEMTVKEACEHGRFEGHWIGNGWAETDRCPGGGAIRVTKLNEKLWEVVDG